MPEFTEIVAQDVSGSTPGAPVIATRDVGDQNPITAAQLQHAVLTNLVINASGEQNLNQATFSAMFPSEPVPSWQYIFPEVFGEDLVPYDTERTHLSEMRYVRRKFGKRSSQMHRYTLAGLIDTDEMANGDPWNLAVSTSVVAKNGVLLDNMMRKANLVKDPASYGASNVVTITSGNGFNQAGAGSYLRDVVSGLALGIETTLGVGRENLTLALLGAQAKEAALSDVNLLKTFVNGTNQQRPGLDRIAEYLGIGNVITANPIFKATNATPGAPIFGGGGYMVLFYNSRQMMLPNGGISWARNFNWGGEFGAALVPFFDEKTTSWWYPWQLYSDLKILIPDAAALIVAPYQTS